MKSKFLFISIIFAALLSFTFSTIAQSYMFEDEDEGVVKLVIGEVTIFNVVSPERVSIRNPDIADISKVTDSEVVVVARLGGDTVLTVWDKQGRRSYNISVLPRDLEIVQDKLKELINKNLRLKEVYFRKNEVTGKIMVMGKVNPVQKEHIERILEAFSDSVDNLLTLKDESKMVEIDCQILEISRNDIEEIGIKWQEFLQLREEPYSGSASSESTAVNTTLDRSAPWTKLWPVKLWSRDALHARLDMLISNGKGRILSRPKLLCLSGKEARLVVGGEMPYVSASSTNTVGTQVEVEYRDYGVILDLKPIINEDDQIILDIATEVSELDTVNGITVASISVPAFTKREANTVLNVVSGDTIFIGGLIQNEQAKTIEKIPALGNIPILGALFRSKDFQDNETELVITLTPRLVESQKKEEHKQFSQGPVATLPKKMAIFPEHLQDEELLNDYILRVQRMIAQSLNYPRLAQEAGWQGAVTLRVHLNNDGEVLAAKVSQGSGYVSFDNNVLATAKALSPYPPFPPSIDVENLWIDIPIVYQMD
jgi:pilus assembly protein CpaC